MTMLNSFLSGIGLLEMTIPKLVMILIAFSLTYLAISKKYEPFLLLPISFGMLIANLPISGLSAYDEGGLIWFLHQGVARGIYPPLIFLCLGAMTDFGPLIANPRTAIIGLGGQLGIFAAFIGALMIGNLFVPVIPGFEGFGFGEAASIAIIGSSDGPTAILTTSILAPNLLAIITIAAYSYMALIPIIQPPIMRALTTEKERAIIMPEPKRVSKRKKIIFPLAITVFTVLLIPAAGTLISMLMLGNLIKESGVVERFERTLTTDALNLLTLFIGLSIGASASAEQILNFQTLLIIGLGLFAFCVGTAGGVLLAKLVSKLSGGTINPLIGNSGVSAMPMAARVSQKMGQEYNPQNHLLMHAMGPLVSSTLGSAVIAGIFIAIFSA